MIVKLLLNTQTIWMIFIKTLKDTIVFDMITVMFSNKKLNLIVTELFIADRKLSISLVFITKSSFAEPKKYIRIYLSTVSLWKFQRNKNFNKLHLVIHQVLMNLNRKSTAKPYSFLVIDATLASDNLSRFRKNILDRI